MQRNLDFVDVRIIKMEVFDFDFTKDHRIFVYVDSSFDHPDYEIYEKINWYEYNGESEQWTIFHSGRAFVKHGEYAFVDFVDDIEISRQDSSNMLIVHASEYGPEGPGKSLWKNDEYVRNAGYFGRIGFHENVVKFDVRNDSTIYLACVWAAPETGFLRSIDSGITWRSIFDSTEVGSWYPEVYARHIKISPFNSDNIVLSGLIRKESLEELSFIATTDFGSTWYENPYELFTVNDFEFISHDSVIFHTNNGRYVSSAGGANPILYDSLISNRTFYDLADNQFYFSIENSLMTSDTKGLASWTLVDSFRSRIVDIFGVDDSDSVYVCTEHAVFTYDGLKLDTMFGLSSGLSINDDLHYSQGFRLEQNFPNPFNTYTNINYSLKQSGNVRIDVFDLLGNKISTLISEYQNPGSYSVRWDGKSDNEMEASSGIYVLRLMTDASNETKKMIMLR